MVLERSPHMGHLFFLKIDISQNACKSNFLQGDWDPSTEICRIDLGFMTTYFPTWVVCGPKPTYHVIGPEQLKPCPLWRYSWCVMLLAENDDTIVNCENKQDEEF